MSPMVSIIVTTKNEEKNIENCLRSVKEQTYKNIELIVVDNFSEDKTVENAEKYTTKVYLKGPERSSQRNYGVQVSCGKYLLYLDADMILSPSVIEECVEKCEVNNIDALYIPERIIGEGFWIKVRDFERSFYNGTVIDAVRFIRKDLFERIGGFDENLTGPEDCDLDRRIREVGEVEIITAPLYHNERRFSFKRYFDKKRYYSKTFDKYVQKWGRNNLEIKKQYGLYYRLFGVFIEAGKWKKLLKHPINTFGVYLLLLGYGAVHLRWKIPLRKYHENITSRFTGRHQACINLSRDVNNKVILDVGCWIGWYEKHVADRCKLIVGIDIDSKALLNAKKNANLSQCEFIRASAYKLPFKADTFDLVSMFDVIEHLHINSENENLSKVNRVLRLNGELLVSVPNNNLASILLDPAYFLLGHRHYSLHKIDKMLVNQGFSIQKREYGGGIVEALSLLLLYLFKHLFNLEIPFKKFSDYMREKEYHGRGFVSLFVKAIKVRDNASKF